MRLLLTTIPLLLMTGASPSHAQGTKTDYERAAQLPASTAGRVFRAPDMLADPQFAAREAIVETPHPVFGSVRMQNAFPRLTETPGSVRWPGPALGEHTDEVLSGRLGLKDDEIAALRGRGVI